MYGDDIKVITELGSKLQEGTEKNLRLVRCRKFKTQVNLFLHFDIAHRDQR